MLKIKLNNITPQTIYNILVTDGGSLVGLRSSSQANKIAELFILFANDVLKNWRPFTMGEFRKWLEHEMTSDTIHDEETMRRAAIKFDHGITTEKGIPLLLGFAETHLLIGLEKEKESYSFTRDFIRDSCKTVHYNNALYCISEWTNHILSIHDKLPRYILAAIHKKYTVEDLAQLGVIDAGCNLLTPINASLSSKKKNKLYELLSPAEIQCTSDSMAETLVQFAKTTNENSWNPFTTGQFIEHFISQPEVEAFGILQIAIKIGHLEFNSTHNLLSFTLKFIQLQLEQNYQQKETPTS